MSAQLTKLSELEAQLDEARQRFSRAARPLERLSEMDDEQREKIASELRAAWAGLEAVTSEISKVLRSDGCDVS